MALRELPKPRWHTYLEEVSRAFGAKRVEVEVTGLGLGDRIAADWVSLIGFSYDCSADVISIATGQITHRVHRPRRVYLDYAGSALRGIEVIDADGKRHSATLNSALELPAPRSRRGTGTIASSFDRNQACRIGPLRESVHPPIGTRAMKPPRKQSTHRQTQLMDEPRGDAYRSKRKPAAHAACPDCGAVFEGGRWTWGARRPDAADERCPACRRIRDKLPAGFVRIEGAIDALREELLHLVRNHETHMKAEHPLERIIAIESHPDHVMVTTTGTHLARGIGDALHHAHQGTLDCRYSDDESLLRVSWRR